jgi:hypothetical protein
MSGAKAMHFLTSPRWSQRFRIACVSVTAISVMFAPSGLLAQTHGKEHFHEVPHFLSHDAG